MFTWIKWKFFRRPWMELSFGELIDKRAILRVKHNRLTSKSALKMVGEQLDYINAYLFKAIKYYIDADLRDHVLDLMFELEGNHYRQWDYEDRVFDSTDVSVGIKAAKDSRTMNTIRAKIKREIDLMFNEKFLEAKDYAQRKELE